MEVSRWEIDQSNLFQLPCNGKSNKETSIISVKTSSCTVELVFHAGLLFANFLLSDLDSPSEPPLLGHEKCRCLNDIPRYSYSYIARQIDE